MTLLKHKNSLIFLVSSLTLVVPLILGIYMNGVLVIIEQLELHAVVETSGAVMSLILSMLLFAIYKEKLLYGRYQWGSVALIVMAIFDIFHAMMFPGESFVWLHSLAVFAGGLLFTFVWLKEIHVSHRVYYWIPMSATALSLVIVTLSLQMPEIIPKMLQNGQFTGFSIWMNVIGGIGFIIAGIHFMTRYYITQKNDDLLFAGLTFLFGTAGVLFSTSALWTVSSWWLWHFLRFVAYSITLYYTYVLFMRKSYLLHQEKELLALQVAQKTRELLQQSRMAQMGEMISMIAHQWRQPLGAIASTSIDLGMKIELEIFDLEEKQGREQCQEYFDDGLKKIDELTQSLTNTIDDFRNFYKPNKEADFVLLSEPIQKALNIIKSSLTSNGIELVTNCLCDKKADIYSNELMQVILNILKNAQDNFKEKAIKNPKITIGSKCSIKDEVILEISDNGGGIDEDILLKIFDPYFSTKSEKNGTGLGLYMCKTIIEEHHKGSLKARNIEDGVCFTITLNKA